MTPQQEPVPMPPPSPNPVTMRLSVKDAAKILGVAQTTVHGMYQRGEIAGTKEGNQLWLDAASVAAAPVRGRGHPRENDPKQVKRVQTARCTADEFVRWRKAAAAQRLPVGKWLSKLANENS